MGSPRTIVIVNDYAHINGGAGYVALRSAIGLAERGFRVLLLSACSPVMPELANAGVEVVTTEQFDILSNPSRVGAAMQGIWNERARHAMERVLAPLDPLHTVVHVHGWTKALSSSAISAASRSGAGVIATLHDYFAACPNGGFFDYRAASICNEKALSLGCVTRNCDSRSYAQKLWRIARQQVQRSVGGMPGRVRNFICVSRFSENILRPYLPHDARLFQVSNPIDVGRGVPVDVANNQLLAVVGRLSREKGVLLFAEAASEAGIAPLFVGDGPLRAEILARCPHATITGWLPREEVTRTLEIMRAIVFPSLTYETQGLVVLEAAARGIPAVIADTSAAREAVSDGESGLWFRGGNRESLVVALRRVVTDGAVAAWGRTAYDRYWSSPSTIGIHVDALLQCYDAVLDGRMR